MTGRCLGRPVLETRNDIIIPLAGQGLGKEPYPQIQNEMADGSTVAEASK